MTAFEQAVQGVVVEEVHDVATRQGAPQLGHLLTEALAQSSELVVITGADGSIEWVNPAFELLTGLSLDQLVGMEPGALCSDDSLRTLEALCREVRQGGRGRGRLVVRGVDGLRLLEATVSPVLDADGQVRSYFSLSHDVSEEEAERHRMSHAARMEAVGRTVRAVTHTLNNHLTVIESTCQFALQTVGPDDQLAEDIREIRSAGRRIALLTDQLRALNREPVVLAERVDVCEVLRGAGQRLRDLLGDDVGLELSADEPELVVQGNESHLEQILLNLCHNSSDAMPRGGTLSIRAERVSIAPRPLPNGTATPATALVRLTVADTGSGIDAADVERIFEPFFSTKQRRLGLGLSIVEAIVAQLGGEIEVQSDLGRGTTLRITLPLAETAVGRDPGA